MLETIHEYAREKLAESGEAEPLEREHAHYVMKLVEEAERELTGAGVQEWFDRLEDANDNLRAALRWAREGGTPDAAETGLRIAGVLWDFWSMRGDVSEGREQLERALDAAGGHRDPPLHSAGLRTSQDGHGDPPLQRGYASPYLAKALNGAGNLAWLQGDFDAARALHTESLALRRELGDKSGIAGS